MIISLYIVNMVEFFGYLLFFKVTGLGGSLNNGPFIFEKYISQK